jgi:hypothetical protein
MQLQDRSSVQLMPGEQRPLLNDVPKVDSGAYNKGNPPLQPNQATQPPPATPPKVQPAPPAATRPATAAPVAATKPAPALAPAPVTTLPPNAASKAATPTGGDEHEHHLRAA